MSLPSSLSHALLPQADASAQAVFDPAAAGEEEKHLGFTVEEQQGDQWCWAAVSVSLRAFQNPGEPRMKQCALAETVLPGGLNCCDGTDHAPPQCDKAALLDDGLKAAGVNATRTGALQFNLITPEIDAKRPVACRIDFPPPQLPHFVVIEGYIEGNERQYSVSDPLRGKGMMDVETFKNNYAHAGGEWHSTFLLT